MYASKTHKALIYIHEDTSKETSPKFLILNDIKIPARTEVKLLRMTIDNKLRFDINVDKLSKSAGWQLNVLNRFRWIFDIKEKRNYFKFQLLSHYMAHQW